VLSLLFAASLSADLIDWVKKAEDKSSNHGIQNIDFIYMINLDQRPEKFKQASEELLNYGIDPYRFSAVNGWELSLQAINDVGLKCSVGMQQLFATAYPIEMQGEPVHEYMSKIGRAYFVHGLTRGSIGCALSHISVLKDALDSNYKTIWVLEDDITVLQDPRRISDLIDELDHLVGKGNWDVLFTDQDYRLEEGKYLIATGAAERPDMDCSIEERYSPRFTEKMQISPDFQKISARFATHSMIIRKSGMEKLLEWSLTHQIFLPYDLENYLPPEINRYALTYDVVSNALNPITDNARPTYE
jgi:GR25 family glycosyltransferase involved in LPS biosynthesis